MDKDPEIQCEMPRYRCYKEVWALKIAVIAVGPDGGAAIGPEDAGYTSFQVPASYVQKHEPKVGGYYVVYRDGYRSFSPASEFEDGYTLIP